MFGMVGMLGTIKKSKLCLMHSVVWFSIELKFNSFELDPEVGRLISFKLLNTFRIRMTSEEEKSSVQTYRLIAEGYFLVRNTESICIIYVYTLHCTVGYDLDKIP